MAKLRLRIVLVGFAVLAGGFSLSAHTATTSSQSSGGVLRVEGTAEGTGAAAVAEADDNALMAAMADYLAQFVPDGDLRVFQGLLEDPKPFVRSFTRIDSHIEDGVTVVALRVSLDEEAIRREAASILSPQLGAHARYIVLIPERGIGAGRLTLTRDGVAGECVIDVLRQAGLPNVVGAEVLLKEYGADTLLSQLMDDTAIRTLLRENAADAAVVGRAVLQSALASAGSNLLEHRAELELRIVGARAGAYTLRSDAKVLSGELERGGQTALRDACTKIKDEIIPLSILAAAQSGVGGGVLVAVRGNVDAEGIQAIVERLRRVPGVGEVEELRHEQGILRLYAPYTGELGPLYRHLTWDPYDSFRLSAELVIAREIRLEVIPNS